MDRGDGQAQPHAVMRRAIAEPLERLEHAVGIRRADDRPVLATVSYLLPGAEPVRIQM
jgi:hypothetical protein